MRAQHSQVLRWDGCFRAWIGGECRRQRTGMVRTPSLARRVLGQTFPVAPYIDDELLQGHEHRTRTHQS